MSMGAVREKISGLLSIENQIGLFLFFCLPPVGLQDVPIRA